MFLKHVMSGSARMYTGRLLVGSTRVDLEIFGLIKTLSNGTVLYDPPACRYVNTPSAYDTAANQLPIFFLPPDDIASRRVSQHKLSFLFHFIVQNFQRFIRLLNCSSKHCSIGSLD